MILKSLDNLLSVLLSPHMSWQLCNVIDAQISIGMYNIVQCIKFKEFKKFKASFKFKESTLKMRIKN